MYRDELMNGVMLAYINDDVQLTYSLAGSPTSTSTTTTTVATRDSNANVVVSTAHQLNGSVEEAPSDVDSTPRQLSERCDDSKPVQYLADIAESTESDLNLHTTSMTAAEGHSDFKNTVSGESSSQLSSPCSHVDAPSAAENPKCGQCVPDSTSASTCKEELSWLSVSSSSSSQASSEPTAVDGQSVMHEDVPSVNRVESRSVTKNTDASITQFLSDSEVGSAAGAGEDTRGDVSYGQGTGSSASSACRVPVMSVSCSSLASRLGGGYLPSPGPLAQMYGGAAAARDVAAASNSTSQQSPTTSSSSSWSRNSMYSPLKVGGDVSEITAKISAARGLCSRGGLGRAGGSCESEGCRGRGGTSSEGDHGGRGCVGGQLRTADSRSTPWLPTVDRGVVRSSPSSCVVPPALLSHSWSVSGSLAVSGGALTPLASRSSSLVSNDSSTLRTSTLVPDNSCK